LERFIRLLGKKNSYPSIEEKAAHSYLYVLHDKKSILLLMEIQRIAAALFLWFLEMNKYLYGKDKQEKNCGQCSSCSLLAYCGKQS